MQKKDLKMKKLIPSVIKIRGQTQLLPPTKGQMTLGLATDVKAIFSMSAGQRSTQNTNVYAYYN